MVNSEELIGTAVYVTL